MPKIRVAVGRGVGLVFTTPLLAVATLTFVAVVWFLLLAVGYRGSLHSLVTIAAIPPLGSFGDATIARGFFDVDSTQFAVIGLVIVRGILTGLLAGLTVDALRGRVSRWSVVRGARAIPAGVLGSVLAFMVAFVVSTASLFLGAAFTQLAQIGAPILGIYLFGFASVVAANEPVGAAASVAKSVRAARLPGGGNVLFAAAYVMLAIFIQIVSALLPGRPALSITSNPSVTAWVYVLIANLIHVGMFAALCYRYLSIADEVPEPPERSKPARRRR